MLKPPFSSEFDPSEEGEGSIDPLGLQPGYERLADRLLPAITVRMGNPRLVTAMALGARVCEDWDTDAVASDGITPPWLVWEWFVVEAFVRAEDSQREVSGVPGTRKVRRALRTKRPVGATSYLKTPTAFGFTGVFRRLAVGIGILTDDGHLDDRGYELLAAWAKDQALAGIIDASTGDGHAFRERLRHAVGQGMEKGHTTWQSRDFWRELAQRLDPLAPGSNERKFLLDQILLRAGQVDMVVRLKDALIAEGGVGERQEEAPFLRKLSASAPADFKELLTAIDAYEAFGRAITDAFDGLRHCASINGGAAVGPQDFSATPAAKRSLAALAPSLARIREHPKLLEWEHDRYGLLQAIELFETVHSSAELFDAVLNHHEHVQDNKPPNGKRTWFERSLPGKIVLRPGYVLPEASDGEGSYVHEYRIPTFSRFLGHLGALP